MDTFYSDWIFSIADMNIKTDPKGRCVNKNFLLYIQMYES